MNKAQRTLVIRAAMSILGSRTSPQKKAAARANAKKPRKKTANENPS